jgi:hypothetical protein
MRVMAKQATNKVSTIKLLDGKYKHAGEGTLKELFRVHCPASKLIDDLGDERGKREQEILYRHFCSKGRNI